MGSVLLVGLFGVQIQIQTNTRQDLTNHTNLITMPIMYLGQFYALFDPLITKNNHQHHTPIVTLNTTNHPKDGLWVYQLG